MHFAMLDMLPPVKHPSVILVNGHYLDWNFIIYVNLQRLWNSTLCDLTMRVPSSTEAPGFASPPCINSTKSCLMRCALLCRLLSWVRTQRRCIALRCTLFLVRCIIVGSPFILGV